LKRCSSCSHSPIIAGAALTKCELPKEWGSLLRHDSMPPTLKGALLFNIKTTAMSCTQPRVKVEYLMAELEVAVSRTIRRCLWAAAKMAKDRGAQQILVEDVSKAVAKYAGLSHLRCNQEDHDQSAARFQLRMPAVARYTIRLLPKGWMVHLLAHKYMAIRLGFMVATLVTEVMVTKERTGAGLNETTAALILGTAIYRDKMGSGTPEAEQEEPVDMVTHVGDPISKQKPPWKSPSVQDDTEETALRQIFVGGDSDPVEDVGLDGLRDEASKLLEVWYCFVVSRMNHSFLRTKATCWNGARKRRTADVESMLRRGRGM
jgi:hypothetical protein